MFFINFWQNIRINIKNPQNIYKSPGGFKIPSFGTSGYLIPQGWAPWSKGVSMNLYQDIHDLLHNLNYLTWDKSGMDVVTSLQPDPINGVVNPFNTKTPLQEPQKTCTRNLPCLQQGCMICSTPTTRFATTSWKQTWYSFFTTAQTSVPTIRICPRSCWRFVPQIIKTLQANSEISQQFHNAEDLHSISLIQSLIQNIMRSLPLEVRLIFTNQFMEFRRQYPANFRPSAGTFLFLSQFVNKLEKSYWLNPSLFNLNYTLAKIGIEPLRYGHPTAMKKKPPYPPSGTSPEFKFSNSSDRVY